MVVPWGWGGEKHELVRDDHVLCACGSSLLVDYLWFNQ